MQLELAHYFGVSVTIRSQVPVPQNAFHSKRNQYYSSVFLEILKRIRKKEERMLGIVDVDLFVPALNFVFGEADREDKVCIISLVRLRQEIYGLPKNKKIFFLRVLKEAIYELGHTYQLNHCTDPKCVMHFSNSLKVTDRKGPGFCPQCSAKLR